MSAKVNARKTQARRRNAGRPRFLPKLQEPPKFKDVAAAALGGGGTALLGGWLANKGVSPTLVGLGLGVAGAVGSFAVPPGPWRVAASGVAAAGASQFALTMMHKQAVEQIKQSMAAAEAQAQTQPSNAAFPAGMSDAFLRRRQLDARTIDDEERLTDPDFEYDAAG